MTTNWTRWMIEIKNKRYRQTRQKKDLQYWPWNRDYVGSSGSFFVDCVFLGIANKTMKYTAMRDTTIALYAHAHQQKMQIEFLCNTSQHTVRILILFYIIFAGLFFFVYLLCFCVFVVTRKNYKAAEDRGKLGWRRWRCVSQQRCANITRMQHTIKFTFIRRTQTMRSK